MRPARIQLKRTKGFNLQESSLALNGLPAVKVDRTTKFGNPFKIGQENPYGTITKNARHSWQVFLGFAQQNEKLVALAITELRGKNLACWCKADEPCHADVLLDLANKP